MAKIQKTILGYKCNFDLEPEKFDDIELLEDFEQGKFPSVFKKIFGDTEYQKIKNHFRDKETGICPVSKLGEFFEAVASEVGTDPKA